MINRRRLLAATTAAVAGVLPTLRAYAAAKARPGTLNFGTINAGSAQNMSAELFRTLAGIDVTIIPYKTTPDFATAVLRGDVDVAFDQLAFLAVGLGPGLFTGLRVGITTARVMAQTLRVPVVGVPTLDLIAYPLRHTSRTVVSVVDESVPPSVEVVVVSSSSSVDAPPVVNQAVFSAAAAFVSSAWMWSTWGTGPV